MFRNKLLILILIAFFAKQLLLSAVFPIFQGPDEPVHYSTIQFKQEPGDKKYSKRPNKIKTKIFSQEIEKTLEFAESEKISFHSDVTQTFTESSQGKFENEIKGGQWKKYIPEGYAPNTVGGIPGYYFLPSLIEKALSQHDIFVRFFAIRIFSSILGTLIVLLTYLSAKKIGFDKKISLLLSIAVAFQPMFSQAAAIINYDILLIFFFTLFIFGAIWSFKDGPNWKNGTIMLVSTILGLLTKAPAVALAISFLTLVAYFFKKYLNLDRKISILVAINASAIIIIVFGLFSSINYFNFFLSPFRNSKFNSIFYSIDKYVSVTLKRWDWSELSYWGNFGWLDTEIPSWIVNIAHCVEIAALAGIIAYFVFPKKIPAFLPSKKIVVFLIGIFLSLQFAVRFADWSSFNSSGKIEFGTHGRYFLPVIGAQFFLIATGIGMLVRKYSIWKNILKVLSVSMIILWIYSLLIIIIPRYYL